MADINQNLIDLSPESVARHIAAGRAERSMIIHRALTALGVWLRRGPRRRPMSVDMGRLAGMGA